MFQAMGKKTRNVRQAWVEHGPTGNLRCPSTLSSFSFVTDGRYMGARWASKFLPNFQESDRENALQPNTNAPCRMEASALTWLLKLHKGLQLRLVALDECSENIPSYCVEGQVKFNESSWSFRQVQHLRPSKRVYLKKTNAVFKKWNWLVFVCFHSSFESIKWLDSLSLW